MATILGVLAMLVALGGPPAAVAAIPCAEKSMGMAAMPDGQAPCQTADKACVSPCLAAGKCQHQCGSLAFVAASLDNGLSLFEADVVMAEELPPPGSASPVDGPPPRI